MIGKEEKRGKVWGGEGRRKRGKERENQGNNVELGDTVPIMFSSVSCACGCPPSGDPSPPPDFELLRSYNRR
jgi:hypothetical protein